jgi:hypothetical protein
MFSGKEFKDWDFLNWCRSKGLNSLRIIWKNKDDITLKLNEEALDRIHSYDIFVYLWQDGSPLGICLDVNKDVKEAYKLSLKLPTPTFVIVAKEDKENKEVLSFFWDIEDRLSEQDYEQISNLLREKFPNLALSNKFRPPNSWESYFNSEIVWLKVGESYSKDTFLQHLNYFLAPLPEKEEKEKEEEIPTKCQLIENLYSLPFSELKDFALEFLSYDAIINNKEHIFQRKCIDSKIHPSPYLQKALLQNSQDNIPSCRIIASLSKDELDDLFGNKFDSHPCENCYFNFSLRKPFYQFKKLTIPKGYIEENGIIREKKTETTIAYDFDVDSILEIKENRSLNTKIVARKGRELQYIDFASGKEILSSFKTPYVKKFREFIAEFISKNKHLIIHQKGYSGYDFETKTWNILNLHYTEPRISETLDISKKGKQEDFISILKDIVSLMTENKDFYLAIPLCGALNFLEKPSDPAPAYLISGLPETGKTLRLSLINFLVRYPKPLDFTTISEAFIKSQLPKIKAFICVDNVSDNKRKYAERLTILLNLNEISSSYIPLILASSKIKNYNHKSILHLKIEEKNDELLEEYSKILQKILHLPCYGHLFKISNDLCQIKQMSNLPIEINPNLFSFKSNYMAFKSALHWWHSLCSYLDVNFNITQEDIMNFINENFSTQKEYILLSLLDHIHQKFKGKSSVYWREIKQELGINDDIFKILLCNEWSYHDNGFGKKYPVLRITKNSPMYQLWKGIPIQETELISKILENKEIIESQTDYKFKVSDKEIKSLISNFINLCSNFNPSESFH